MIDEEPINWCGSCSRRFRGFGTFCERCREIEKRKIERAQMRGAAVSQAVKCARCGKETVAMLGDVCGRCQEINRRESEFRQRREERRASFERINVRR
jgi:hypothetical protein